MSHDPSLPAFDPLPRSAARCRPSPSFPPRDAFPPLADSADASDLAQSRSGPPLASSDPLPTAPSLSFGFFDSSSQPVDFPPPHHRYLDQISHDDFTSAYRGSEQHFESGTPSYCGSWTSDYSASASPTRFSNSNPALSDLAPSSSFEHLYEQAASKTQQLSLDPTIEMPPFDSTTFDEPLAMSTEAQVPDASAPEGKDRDMTLTMPRASEAAVANLVTSSTSQAGGGGGNGQRPYAFTRNSSGFGSFFNYANSPATERARPATPAYSATRSTVYDPAPSAVSESSTSTVAASVATPASSTTTANGTPALSKLEIPSAPVVSLTGPTPETAKPRPKGRGTLELERVLGLWAAKTPTSSFPNLPPLSSGDPVSPSSTSTPASSQPLFAQSIVSSEPESFVATTTTRAASSGAAEASASASSSFAINNPLFPSFGGPRGSRDSLAPPPFPPRRRRSKSDTDVMRLDSLGFPHSNLPVGPYVDPPPVVTSGPTFTSNVAPPTPVDGPSQRFSMNPNETWHSPDLPSSSYTTNPVAALDLNNPKQRELSTRDRSPHFGRDLREASGPGYREAALLDVNGADGGRGRRARSQGAGHRPSKSDDFSHLLPSMQQSISQPLLTTSSNGLLAPPQPVSQPQPQPQAHFDAQAQPQAPSPVPSAASPVPSHAGSPFQQPQQLPSLPQPPPPSSFPAYPPQQTVPSYPTNVPSYAHHPHLPHPPAANPQNPVYSSHPQYSQAPPAQGYLANQAALLASAALIAFNPTDPAHAAAAAAGYLPPSYPQFPSHPYNVPYGSPYGANSGLPPLPPHHQNPSPQLPYPPRLSNGLANPNRPSLVNSRDPSPGRVGAPGAANGSATVGSRTHPAYAYHSPLGQLPSPPSTSQSHSPANSGYGGGATRTSARATRRRAVVKHEDDEGPDEDESMMRLDEDGRDEGEGDEDDDEEEDDEDEDEEGRSSSALTSTSRGKGKRGATKSAAHKARAKRQVSEEGFSEKSKTTQATIDAAKRRRNANAVAKFVCDLCGETFTRRYNLRGHQRAHNGEKPYKCSYEGCDKAFARAHDCKRHELLHLGVRKYHCSPCKRDFVRLDALHRHHRSEVGQACVKQLEAEGYVFDEKGAAVAL